MRVRTKFMITVAAIVLVMGSSLGQAQSIKGEPVDLKFEIINATDNTPGTAERLLLQYSSDRLSSILDIEPTGSTFDVTALPVLERGKYILTVWSSGVPYYWSLRGRNLMEDPVKLHVFSTATGLDDVTITGLNLLIRKTESMMELEYMLQIENNATPQVTLVGGPSLQLALPSGIGEATLVYGNGPDPDQMTLSDFSGGRVVLKAPLTTGRNIMRVKASMAWQDGLDIPIGSNVSIDSWSLMVTPEGLDVQSFDLEPTDSSELHGYSRYKGLALQADERFNFRIADIPSGGVEEDLFTKTPDKTAKEEPKAQEKAPEKDKGFPFVVLTPIFVVILAVVVRQRRRS